MENVENENFENTENVALDTPMYNPENANTVQDVSLATIHEDLGIITSFIALFSVVLLIKVIYKFFKMFF